MAQALGERIKHFHSLVLDEPVESFQEKEGTQYLQQYHQLLRLKHPNFFLYQHLKFGLLFH